MSATAATTETQTPPNTVDRDTRWIIVQVDDKGTLFVEPGVLKLEKGWVGNIVWYVFTAGHSLPEEGAIVFEAGSTFDGNPTPDPSRPGCWSTAASNNNVKGDPAKQFHYHITVQKPDKTKISGDPVIENEPVP